MAKPSEQRISGAAAPRARGADPDRAAAEGQQPARKSRSTGRRAARLARSRVRCQRPDGLVRGRSRRWPASTCKVRANLVTAIIGPSGCGKTTFIRRLNRMNESVPGFRVEGQVLYHGHDVYGSGVDRVEVRRRIGMVFQKPNPFREVDLRQRRLGAAQPRNEGSLDERVERALSGAALWDEVKDRLREGALGLSGGQQQRLCIARAIAIEPDVLLLDEPASALDPIATAAIEELMHTLKDRYTIVIVTHNMQQAARVADRTAFFTLGSTDGEQVGTLVEVGRHGDDLHPAGPSANPGLRHRAASVEPRPGGQPRLGAFDGVARGPARAAAGRIASRRRRRCCAALRRRRRRRRFRSAPLRDALDLAELGIHVLKDRRAPDEHVDADAVPDRHLVHEPAEVPLHLRDAGSEGITAPIRYDQPFGFRRPRGGTSRREAGFAVSIALRAQPLAFALDARRPRRGPRALRGLTTKPR